MSRPRGYFGVPRDRIVLDGTSPPAGIPPGVAGLSDARLKLADAAARPIVGEFNDERIVGRVWPAAEQPRHRARADLLTGRRCNWRSCCSPKASARGANAPA